MLTDKTIAKPFIKWAGGKRQLIKDITNTLPDNFAGQEWTYIEPFIGGGALLFYMLQTYPNIEHAIINDINNNLVTAYKTVRNNALELISELKCIQTEYISLDEIEQKNYFLQKRAFFNSENLTPLENTSTFIFLNKTCFNGLYRVNSKGLFNVPHGRYKNPLICDEQTILADSKLLQKVKIVSGDFENTEAYATNNTFFYFDPPYRPLNSTSSFNSYTKEVFNDSEQIRLRDFCNRLTLDGHSIVLSNSDCRAADPEDTFFDDLYQEFIIDRVWATRSVNANPDKRGKLTELLIRNYNNEL